MIARSLLATLGAITATDDVPDCPQLLDLELRQLGSDETIKPCDAYRGKVLLIVNTASKCGFTSQYEGLETLYRRYKDRGLMVLGFPSNDFLHQEPGNETEIAQFCRLTYDVDFPMFEKIAVKKGRAHPLFQRLAAAGAPYPKWNFYKYLIDRHGQFAAAFSSVTTPTSGKLTATIERLLNEGEVTA